MLLCACSSTGGHSSGNGGMCWWWYWNAGWGLVICQVRCQSRDGWWQLFSISCLRDKPPAQPGATKHLPPPFLGKVGNQNKVIFPAFVLNCWLIIMTFMTCLSRIMYVLYRGKDVTNTTSAPSVEHNLATFLIIKT